MDPDEADFLASEDTPEAGDGPRGFLRIRRAEEPKGKAREAMPGLHSGFVAPG
jgi:hypothetical protein